MTLKLALLAVVLLSVTLVQLSQQAIYPYNKAVAKTLSDLDLKKLEGRWYGLYHRREKGSNEVCPKLDVVIGNGNYVNVTESRGNAITFQQKMEQNQYLKGKISQIINLPAGYSVERPWFITQVDPLLVIYQVTTGNKSDDNWSVYSRTQTSNRDHIQLAAQKLVEAGAEQDSRGNYGYQCQH